ncbi:MAG TPA: ABC transporter permease [Gemmataceae bacterium]|nr:ABC transporter permease [Gemmataceae bacterium]
MKFLAILRDSLRETLDVKLFYVMVGLSLLVVLLAASVTYKPVPMKQRIEFENKMVNMMIRGQLQSRPETAPFDFHIDIEDFEQLGDHPEPWLADYRFFYVITVSAPAQDGLPNDQLLQSVRDEVKNAIKPEKLEQDLHRIFTEVKVREAPSKDPGQIRLEVTTSNGTTVKTRQEWTHEPRLFFGLVPIPVPVFTLNNIIVFIGDWIVGAGGAAFTLLISIIMTASFLPNMLAKGSVDLLLVKPIHRTTLFIYKFLGGLLFMFLNTVIIMVGIWLGLGIQSGMWINAFLVCIFVFTFEFAMFYAVSALVAVFTRSAIVSIMAAMMTWGALILLGWTHWAFIEQQRKTAPADYTNHWAYVGYDVLHTVLPRYKDLDWLTSKMIKEELIKPSSQQSIDPNDRAAVEAARQRQKRLDEVYENQLKKLDKEYGGYDWKSSLTVSSFFIVLMLGLACWRFATRDY